MKLNILAVVAIVVAFMVGDVRPTHAADRNETYSVFVTPRQGECVFQKWLNRDKALIWCESGMQRKASPLKSNRQRNAYRLNADGTTTVKFRGRTYVVQAY